MDLQNMLKLKYRYLLPGRLYKWYIFGIILSLLLSSCSSPEIEEKKKQFNYTEFKDSLLRQDTDTLFEANNLFDNQIFVPGQDSLDKMLVRIDTFWRREERLMAQLDSIKKDINKQPGYTARELEVIKENIRAVDSFLLNRDSAHYKACNGVDCILFVQIDKAKQQLYLWIFGELKDSFLVSTGKGKKYETPQMELHPQGPVLTKYTSKKFPGGNYKGLGNMPYAVFLRNGYAIHGTTEGNIPKLGTTASHGCIRLHPDNAKILNALVKSVGLKQTWISIRDSIPANLP